jgi:hypothetical protein
MSTRVGAQEGADVPLQWHLSHGLHLHWKPGRSVGVLCPLLDMPPKAMSEGLVTLHRFADVFESTVLSAAGLTGLLVGGPLPIKVVTRSAAQLPGTGM